MELPLTSHPRLEPGEMLSNGIMVKIELSSPPKDCVPTRKRHSSSNLENVASKRHGPTEDFSLDELVSNEEVMMFYDPCSVCGDKRGWIDNQMFFCDRCQIAVHQACYGIITSSNPWLCEPCKAQTNHEELAKCKLCPNKAGALKQTDDADWVHIVCALFIPEVLFGDAITMAPVILTTVPMCRFHKKCYICKDEGRKSSRKTGAFMQCNKFDCKNHFHATCAQEKGLLFVEPGDSNSEVKYFGYCQKHYTRHMERKDATTTAIPVLKPQIGDSESSGSEFSSSQGRGSSLGQYPDVTRSCQRAKSRQFSRVSSSLEGSFDEADNARRKSRYCGVSPFWNVSSKMGLIPESRVFQLLGGLGSPEPNESSEDEDTEANTTVIEVCKPDDGPSSSCNIPQAQTIAKQFPDLHSETSLMSASSPALRDELVPALCDEPAPASVDEPPPCEEYTIISPPNELPAEENIIQEPVHNFAELKPTKQLTMQDLEEAGVLQFMTTVLTQYGPYVELKRDRDACKEKLLTAQRQIAELTQQVAILKCVMKEMASQVTARKRLQFPTKIMTRSVGLQVNQTSGADKDLKTTTPIRIQETRAALSGKGTSLTNDFQLLETVKPGPSSSHCTPIPIPIPKAECQGAKTHQENECVQIDDDDDDDITEIPVEPDAHFVKPSSSSSVNTSFNQIRRIPPLPTIQIKQSADSFLKPIPPKPIMKLTKIADSISISWTFDSYSDFAEVDSYRIWMFEERSGKLKETNQWEPLEYIKALRLPMVCKIPMAERLQSTDKSGLHSNSRNWYHFAVRATDVHGRIGPFSNVEYTFFP